MKFPLIALWLALLATGHAEPWPMPSLSEIMTDNKGGLRDEEGDSSDWIEIYNPGPGPLNLGSWFLSDSSATLAKWSFPSPTFLEPGAFLTLFASSKNRTTAGMPLHTNFKLDPDGESLFLVRPDGLTIADQILNYPPQEPNVSFGTSQALLPAPLIAAGSVAKVRVPGGTIPDWPTSPFDDAAWTSATLGVGFDQTNGKCRWAPRVVGL